MLLIGSRALSHYIDLKRDKKDWDFVTDRSLQSRPDCEYHHNPVFLELLSHHQNRLPDGYREGLAWWRPSFNELYTLKVSHSFWPIRWDKTMYDIGLMQSEGAQLIEPLFKKLYSYWSQVHRDKSYVNLNVTNERFFNQRVERQYSHDYLHHILAYSQKPLFESIKPDTSRALCSEKMFLELDSISQLNLVREEAQVIALERYYLTGRPSSLKGWYRMALCDLVTRLSKGWFPLFIALNWNELKEPDRDYVQIFKDHINVY